MIVSDPFKALIQHRSPHSLPVLILPLSILLTIAARMGLFLLPVPLHRLSLKGVKDSLWELSMIKLPVFFHYEFFSPTESHDKVFGAGYMLSWQAEYILSSQASYPESSKAYFSYS